MMTPPNGAFGGQYNDEKLASVFNSNATLKAAFEKATGADIEISTFGSTIVFGAPSADAVARIEAALEDMSEALTVPDDTLAAILKKHNF